MINAKLCSFVAIGAFLLSFLVGLVFGAGFPAVFLRAAVFGALSFGFAAGAQALVAAFLPELADGSAAEAAGEAQEASGAEDRPGGTIDLSVGGEEDELFVFAAAAGSADEGSGQPAGLDQAPEGGYTDASGGAAVQAAAARPPELIGDVDELPDLEGLSDSFVTPIVVDDAAERKESRPASAGRAASAGPGGNFDAKEMAMAIQTILKREEKG